MIEIVNGTLDFGKVRVLDNINLNVHKGEICGIIGRNGSGKTVMFKTICGFYKFTKGDLIINNKRLFIRMCGIENRLKAT